MKYLLLSSALLAAAAGLSYAVTDGGDECAASKQKVSECAASVAAGEKGDCPATGLIAKWEKAKEQMANLPAEKLAALASARETLSASCPVCVEAPATFAFVGEFFGTTAAFDGMIAECAEKECEEGAAEIPAEIASAWEERVTIGSRAGQLYGVFASATAPAKAECEASAKASECTEGVAKAAECCQGGEAKDCCQAEKLTFASMAERFEGIAKRAEEFSGRWNGIPARAAALPAETRVKLVAALETMTKEAPFCELSNETMTLLASGLERCVALDAKLSEHCDAQTPEGELPAEVVAMKKAAKARTAATKKVASLLHTMGKTMTPDLFKVQPAVDVAGGGGN